MKKMLYLTSNGDIQIEYPDHLSELIELTFSKVFMRIVPNKKGKFKGLSIDRVIIDEFVWKDKNVKSR